MTITKYEARLNKIYIIKSERIDGFGMFKGAPSFKREKDDRENNW